MPEWTINIESPPATARDTEQLERFAETLEHDARALGAASSLNVQTGQLASTFQVDAPARDEAAFQASLAYWDAIASAGLQLTGDSSLTVALEDGAEAGTYNARADVELVA